MSKKVICNTCNKKFGSIQIFDHKKECLKKYFNSESGYLIEFKSKKLHTKTYIIYAIIGSLCNFQDIDNFLQEIWNYTCNDSSFYILENEKQKEIFKHECISDYKVGTEFNFNYKVDSLFDNYFKIDVNITCNIITKFKGKEKNININLVYQNNPYPLICNICEKNASCMLDTSFYCDSCSLIYFNNLNNCYNDIETDYDDTDETIYTDVDDDYEDNEILGDEVSIDYIINKIKLIQLKQEHIRYRLKKRKNFLEYLKNKKENNVYKPYESESEDESDDENNNDGKKYESYEKYMSENALIITNSPHIIVNGIIDYYKF
jgi:hypothetical protein